MSSLSFCFPSFFLSCIECVLPYLMFGLVTGGALLFFVLGDSASHREDVVLIYRNGAGSPPLTTGYGFLSRPISSDSCNFTAISSAERPHCTCSTVLPSGQLPRQFQLPAAPAADSDLVAAFGLAARAFQSSGGRQPTLLVAQNCMTRQFRALDPASAKPQELIRQLEDEGRIPDLTDVTVYWYYFYDCCGEQPDLTVAQCRYAQTFWELFFQKAGAEDFSLCAELPAPTETEGSALAL